MKPDLAFVLLLAVASAVAIVSRRFRIPYTVALVLAGLGAGAARLFEPPHLTKELLYALCLPGLLFEAAFHLDAKSFWRNKLTVIGLAVPGLIVAILLTAVALTPIVRLAGFADDFTYRHALVFAALIGATDPIAVVALFKSLGAPRRLGIIVEAESLLNDGTAVVVFTVLFAFASGVPTTFASAGLSFVETVGMGMVIGAVIGFGCTKLIQTVDDPMIEITITTLAAYGSFAIAERFHVSGIIATVTAGMFTGSYTVRTSMSPTTRVSVAAFWEYVAFALNSIVFLLIGFEVRVSSLVASWAPILVAWVAVVLSRAAVVAIATAALKGTREKIPWRWGVVMTWGGLRGALSMVLVLSIAADFPHRALLVTMTFGVVTLSLLVQGLTTGALLQWLGLTAGQRVGRDDQEVRRGAVVIARAALDALPTLASNQDLTRAQIESLRLEYQRRLNDAELSAQDVHGPHAELREQRASAARRDLLHAQKDALSRARRQGIIGQRAFEELGARVDAELVASGGGVDSPGMDDEPAPPSR